MDHDRELNLACLGWALAVHDDQTISAVLLASGIAVDIVTSQSRVAVAGARLVIEL